jgi:nucleoside-diphosphate-sugar epimerase
MSSTSEKVLVTGGAGFIGSHLCEALVAQGDDIVVVMISIQSKAN